LILVSVLLPVRAEAHAEAKPSNVKAGARATITFVIEHGCSGSPTTGVAVKLPSGVTKPAATNPKGWTSSTKGNVVNWSGGTLPAKTEGSFQLTMTFPSTAAVLTFPLVQTCAKGTVRWIEGPKADRPAPTVKVN
jgi:periplasmic copper chaperone A